MSTAVQMMIVSLDVDGRSNDDKDIQIVDNELRQTKLGGEKV